jgi:hypothetical protein
MEHRSIGPAHAVHVRCDDHVVIRAEDRRVETRAVQPELDTFHAPQRPQQCQHIAYTRGDYARSGFLFLLPQRDRLRVRITDQ